MKKFIFLFSIISLLNLQITASDNASLSDFSPTIKSDFFESLDWMVKGSYKQFSSTQNQMLGGFALLSTLYLLKNDKRISGQISRKEGGSGYKLISDSSILFNTPIMPALFYTLGSYNNDSKMIQFSKEYLAALSLTLIESVAISIVPIHQRPDQKDLSLWEKAFRGQSSFPSGHVVGYSVLSFKLFQFYGPGYALVPVSLAVITGFERVNTEKHYISDVVASGFLSFFASEGVRMAAGYNNNHPIYKWIFEHELNVSFYRHEEAPGLIFDMVF